LTKIEFMPFWNQRVRRPNKGQIVEMKWPHISWNLMRSREAGNWPRKYLYAIWNPGGFLRKIESINR
jgi:hypothetical protein